MQPNRREFYTALQHPVPLPQTIHHGIEAPTFPLATSPRPDDTRNADEPAPTPVLDFTSPRHRAALAHKPLRAEPGSTPRTHAALPKTTPAHMPPPTSTRKSADSQTPASIRICLTSVRSATGPHQLMVQTNSRNNHPKRRPHNQTKPTIRNVSSLIASFWP